jgi:uncharacterized membrane protein YfcA
MTPVLVLVFGPSARSPGALIGSHWTARLPERVIRLALGGVLVLAGIKLAGVVPGF